jgi:hypothetical protein
MSLVIACACGQKLKVRDEFAGKKVKCPKCGNVLIAPAPPPVEEEPVELLEMIEEEKPPVKPRRVCPFCAKPLSAKAARCPSCRRDLDDVLDKDLDIKKRGSRDGGKIGVNTRNSAGVFQGVSILVGIVLGSLIGALSNADHLMGAAGGAVLGILLGALGGWLFLMIYRMVHRD